MRRCALLLLFVVGMLTFAPRGHAATHEDLSACKLPNGLTLIPERGSPLALEKGGCIFKFFSERLAPNPFDVEDKRPNSVAEVFNRLRREKTGDLAYSSLNDGTFGTISGKIADLGGHYLHELDGEAIEPPRAVWGVKERSGKGETTPGTIEGVVEGHCYVLETVDGKFAVVRLVAKQHRAALVQWAYQPDGTTRFAIPKGNISEVVTAPDVAKPAQDKAVTAQSTREDLSACKLPNGLTVIPQRDSPLALEKGGWIFKFSSERLAPNPFEAEGKRAASVAELFDRLRREQTGDLAYSSLDEGTFVAVSGNIRDVGQHYLHELSGKEIVKPERVWGTKQKTAKGETTPGAIEGVVEGHCYIVECVDGRFAVVRFVAKQERAAVVQWVYQPDGTNVFTIPMGKVIEVASPQPREEAALMPTPREEELRKRVDDHLKGRKSLISDLMALVAQEASAPHEVTAKGRAVEALGEMRAAEATDLLVGQVDFKNPFAGTWASTMEALYPCLAALRKIGKPASLAAVKAIREMHSFDVKGDENRRLERTQLLAIVVHAVEGPEVAKFILERELVKAAPESKKALQEALDYLAAKLQH